MNGTINSNVENNERGLLPYPIILTANKGEPDAMKVVVLHYGSYMTSLSMRKLRDEQGNTYWGIDEDTRERLRTKLMQSVLAFKI
ncbi:helix-turn-helix domain-containing protein [Pseudogracilibacillus sp. ICA-222130]|uniref:helix-turn-helix domain-containing protein n=1 Tax=Pseudogracilibacillus sp. ICA-222130 TaxID=3134655 RepID=UPI0030C65070